jgi:hypothetical protein
VVTLKPRIYCIIDCLIEFRGRKKRSRIDSKLDDTMHRGRQVIENRAENMAEREGFDYRRSLQVAVKPGHNHNIQYLCWFQGHSKLRVRCPLRPLTTSIDHEIGITDITL